MKLQGKTRLRWLITYWKAIAASGVLIILSLVLLLIGTNWSIQHPIVCGQILPAVASVMMTSGVFAVMYEIFIRRQQTEFVLDALDLRESMIQAGLDGISTNYMDYDYGGRINNSNEVAIFVLYAQTWFGRYHAELAEHVAKDGRSLTLCVPSFENDFLEPLARQFRYSVDEMKRRVSEAIISCALLGLSRPLGKDSVVRIYIHRSRPAYSLYRFDDRLLVGTYYASSARRRAPMFEFVRRPGSMFDEFDADFTKVMSEESEVIFDTANGVNLIQEKLGIYVTDSLKRAVEKSKQKADSTNEA